MIGKPLELITYLYNQDKDKQFDLKEHKNKRSPNANNYAWQLMEQIAKVLGTSKDEIYEIMLSRYGTLLRDDNDDLIIIPRRDELKSQANLHIKNIGKKLINDNISNMYAVIKGSSEYDTKEMSIFIDGVVYEAKELDIETKTPNEIANLKSQWEAMK